MNKMLTHLNGYKREAVLAPLFKIPKTTASRVGVIVFIINMAMMHAVSRAPVKGGALYRKGCPKQ